MACKDCERLAKAVLAVMDDLRPGQGYAIYDEWGNVLEDYPREQMIAKMRNVNSIITEVLISVESEKITCTKA